MKLLYGTGNPAKLKYMREMLEGLDLDILGLKDTGVLLDDIDESGNHPLENARIKALAYYRALRTPVFSCDSGLYIEGLELNEQPGVHVRRVNGKVLSDEEMIAYYSGIAAGFGGAVRAAYKNAICLVLDEEHIYEYDGEDIASGPFLIVTDVHPKRDKGFPLDSISIEIASGRHYMDLEPTRKSVYEDSVSMAYRSFFLKALHPSAQSRTFR
jgi:XTP/dITP diphosphohydrolase